MNEAVNHLRKDTKAGADYFLRILAFTTGPVEVKELLERENIKLVDVRAKADYDASHIPGAVSIPKDELTNNLESLSKNETTYIYCYNQQCHLGARACLILADYGYPAVHVDGGFRTWVEDFGFPAVSSQRS